MKFQLRRIPKHASDCDPPQADLEARDEHGQTSLHLAVTAQQDEIVKVLLEYQAISGGHDMANIKSI